MPMTLGLLLRPFRPSSYTFNGEQENSATYTNAPLGTEDSTRIIVVTICVRQSGTAINPVSCTLAGNAMTLAVDQTPGDGVMIYYLAYPTGTTGTVVWTGNVAGSSMQICTYSVYNAISSTPVVALGGSTSVTVNAVTDDIIIACAHRRGVSSAGWAGVTQDASYNPGSFDSAASIKRTSSLTNVTNSMSETAVVVFR